MKKSKLKHIDIVQSTITRMAQNSFAIKGWTITILVGLFVFLQNDFPVLYQIGIIAEKYLYTDSNVCLIKLGMFGETVVNLMLQLDKISAPQTGIC